MFPKDDKVSITTTESEITPLVANPETNLPLGHVHLVSPEVLPQGRHLGLFSTLILFVSRILGLGFLAISSGIYVESGESPFVFFVVWAIAAVLAFSGLYVWLELGLLVPRSGGTKVFLEFIYAKPYMLASVVILLYLVFFGMSVVNALVFGEYFLHAIGAGLSEHNTRLTALLFVYGVSLIHGLSVNNGVRIQNFIGALKLVLAAVLVLTGMYTTFLPREITGIESQLKKEDFFKVKTSLTVTGFTSAIIKASFAFGGWSGIHLCLSEVKDVVRTFRIAGPLSLLVVAVTFLFTNLAYLAVIPSAEFAASGKLTGSLLFERVFGYLLGRQLLTMLAALCAGGNVFVVTYTLSRLNQEVFREGFLPFGRVMSSNWPFGAPLPALLFSCVLSTLLLLASPSGDVFNYVVTLESYPNQIFTALVAIGIFVLRRRFPDVKAPIRASKSGTVLLLVITSYLILSPLLAKGNPNPQNLQNWPPYPYVALGLLGTFAGYWLLMFRLKPWFFGYSIFPEHEVLRDGLVIKRWVKLYGQYSGEA